MTKKPQSEVDISYELDAILSSEALELCLPKTEYRDVLANLGTLIDKIIDERSFDFIEQGRLEGLEQGQQETLEDEYLLEPKNIFYAIDAFKECKTLADFQQVYKELEVRSYNYYPINGLDAKYYNKQIKLYGR